MLKKALETQALSYEKCHGGIGALTCYSMLEGEDSDSFNLFHRDILPPGVTIGEHFHGDNEEIYFLAHGCCTLICDGVPQEMRDGDFSICRKGHSHGIVNSGDSDAILIVVGAAAAAHSVR